MTDSRWETQAWAWIGVKFHLVGAFGVSGAFKKEFKLYQKDLHSKLLYQKSVI